VFIGLLEESDDLPVEQRDGWQAQQNQDREHGV